MKSKQTLALVGILLVMFPSLTKTTASELLENHLTEKRVPFAWEVEKTPHRAKYKVRHQRTNQA